MTTNDLLEALARLRVETGSLACLGCGHEHNCSTHGCAILRAAADLIERLEKERNALIEAANSRKLCEICKNDSYCFDARCTENTCDDCYQYRVCPCSNCLSHPKFEWKGLENAL